MPLCMARYFLEMVQEMGMASNISINKSNTSMSYRYKTSSRNVNVSVIFLDS